MTSWSLRFTSHLGYRPPFRMQFAHTVGSSDAVAHVELAAKLGMAGVLYPWAMSRAKSEVDAVGKTLEEHGLVTSAIVGVPAAEVGTGLWTDPSRNVEAQLERHTRLACRIANGLGSGVIAALVCDPDPEPDLRLGLEVAAARLSRMADIAADHGLLIGIEPMVSVPTSIIRTTQGAVELVEASGHEAVGIVFDTGHVAGMGDDLRAAFDAAYDHMVIAQLADWPGRVEPTAATLDLVSIGAELVRRGWHGLVDLEHGWASDTPEGEAAGLGRIERFDAAIQRAVAVG
jgi:hydroxypyruvate isomerase